MFIWSHSINQTPWACPANRLGFCIKGCGLPDQPDCLLWHCNLDVLCEQSLGQSYTNTRAALICKHDTGFHEAGIMHAEVAQSLVFGYVIYFVLHSCIYYRHVCIVFAQKLLDFEWNHTEWMCSPTWPGSLQQKMLWQDIIAWAKLIAKLNSF